MAITDQLVQDLNGKRFGVTGSYNNGNPTADWGQCTAVPHYEENLLGTGIVYGDAADTYGNAPDSLFIKELNSPAGVPLPGAIVVFKKGWRGSSVGHTATVLPGTDVNTLRVLEQNNPIGTVTRVSTMDYTGVLGWFYPRALQQATPTPTDVPKADNEGVVNGQGLRGHTEPNTSSPSPWFFDDNEHVTIVARKVDGELVGGDAPYAPSSIWYLVHGNDQNAANSGYPQVWVSDAYIHTTKTPANVPDWTPAPTTPDPTPTDQYSPRPTTGLFGVDVSSFQGDIDFAALVGNIDFLIIRAGHVGASFGGGADETDTKFIQNRDKARQLSEPRAFYWFCYPSLDPADEAKHFANSVGSLEPGESLWADIETDPEAGDHDLIEWSRTFKAEVERLTGRKCRGYYNQDFHDRYPGLKDVWGADGVWAAHYGKAAEIKPFDEAIMHQYTSSGKLPGIKGKVDLNVFFGTADDLAKLGDPIKPSDPAPTPTPDPEPTPNPTPTPSPSPQPDPGTNWFSSFVDLIVTLVKAVIAKLGGK